MHSMSKKRFLWLSDRTTLSRWGLMGARLKKRSTWDRHRKPYMSMAYTMRRALAHTRIKNIQTRGDLHHWRPLKDQLRSLRR